MSKLTTLVLLSLAGSAAAACVDPALDDTRGVAESELTANELAGIKAAVRTLAYANMTRTDNYPAVRAAMEPLVATLAADFGTRPAEEKIDLVAGAWRQIWSDYPYPMTPFISMDRRQIYQVVSPDLHYWNIGDQKALGFVGLTGVLRGRYEPVGPRLNIEFTDVGYRLGRLSRRDSLDDLADGLETGDRYFFPIPGGGRAPNGPVGIRGTLETVYVDADLRIEVGTQVDVLGPSGEVVVPGYGPKLFVLDRVTHPVK